MRAITCILIVSLAAPGIALAAGDVATRTTGPQGSAGTGHFSGWIDATMLAIPARLLHFGVGARGRGTGLKSICFWLRRHSTIRRAC